MKYIFYSSVKNIDDFTYQRFYVNDIYCLKLSGNEVYLSNKIIDFLWFWKYDCAFIYFFKKGFFAALIAKIFFKKVFFTGGIDDLSLNENSFKFLLQKYFFILCYLLSNNIFIVSRSDLKAVEKLTLNDYYKKITYSPHSVFSDYDLRKLFIRKPEKIPHLFTTICWMSTIGNVKRKGVDKSLILFKKYLTVHPNSKFIIIGKMGEGAIFLKSLAEQIGVSENVFFTGNISEVEKIKILSSSTYYFQLSDYEGFGLAALEALFHLNLVIHTAKGGLCDTILNYGFVIDFNTYNFDNFNADLLPSVDFLFKDEILDSLLIHLNNFTHSVRSDKLNEFKST